MDPLKGKKKTSWFGKHLLRWPVRWSSYLVGHPNAAKKYKGFYRGTSSALHLLLGMWLNAIVQMLLQRRPEYHGSALLTANVQSSNVLPRRHFDVLVRKADEISVGILKYAAWMHVDALGHCQ